MWNRLHSHAPEEVLESYVMGKLSEEETAPLEEHLLICPACQNRLEETEQFVHAVRAAAVELRQEPPSFWHRIRNPFVPTAGFPWKPAFLSAVGAVAVAALVMVVWLPRSVVPGEAPYQVRLEAVRGLDDAAIAHSPASRPLILSLSLAELPSFSTYSVQIVDSSGTAVWDSGPQPGKERLDVRVNTALAKGRYWVRLRGGPGAEQLREYGLVIE